MATRKAVTKAPPTVAEKPAKAKTFEEWYHQEWHVKYAEHGNWPTRIEAMREAWDAAKKSV